MFHIVYCVRMYLMAITPLFYTMYMNSFSFFLRVKNSKERVRDSTKILILKYISTHSSMQLFKHMRRMLREQNIYIYHT